MISGRRVMDQERRIDDDRRFLSLCRISGIYLGWGRYDDALSTKSDAQPRS